MPDPGQVPPQAQQTVKAKMQLITFVSKSSQSKKDLEDFDKEVNDFLETIDNQKRFLNGRNAYAVGDKSCVQVWYLEALQPEPVVKPLGKQDEDKPASTKEPLIKT